MTESYYTQEFQFLMFIIRSFQHILTLTNYEVGVSYEVAQNLQLNLGYKDAKYKNLTLKYDGDSTPEFSYEVKGLTYGLTYKF